MRLTGSQNSQELTTHPPHRHHHHYPRGPPAPLSFTSDGVTVLFTAWGHVFHTTTFAFACWFFPFLILLRQILHHQEAVQSVLFAVLTELGHNYGLQLPFLVNVWKRGWLSGRAPDSWLKGAGSCPGRSGWRIFFSRINFLCWLFVRYAFHPHVTAVARKFKRSQSFFQRCRWEVRAKHTCILCMWLRIKWHYKLVRGCMVYTERAPRRQQFHVAPTTLQPNSAVNTSVDIPNALCKATVTHSESHTTGAQTKRIASYSCHCEALWAHLEMRHSTRVHIHK